MINNKVTVPRYVREGLRALVPVYDKGVWSHTEVITRQGCYRDARRLSWITQRIAHHYCLDLKTLRKEYAGVINQKHHISLPFHRELVLLPVKFRLSKKPGESTLGYVNLAQVEAVEDNPGDDVFRTRIIFKSPGKVKGATGVNSTKDEREKGISGENNRMKTGPGGYSRPGVNRVEGGKPGEAGAPGDYLLCLYTLGTLQQRMRQGEEVLGEYLRRNRPLQGFAGPQASQMLELLPDCRCFLKDMLLAFFNFTSAREQ